MLVVVENRQMQLWGRLQVLPFARLIRKEIAEHGCPVPAGTGSMLSDGDGDSIEANGELMPTST